MKCPLCNSSLSRQLIKTESWSIQSCRTCTNAWTHPSPKETKYSERDFHSSTIDTMGSNVPTTLSELPHQWRHSILMQVQLLSRHLDPGARILEIGCGEGVLLSQLASCGFAVQGIEPSRTACARAQMKGLDVINDYFSPSSVQGPYDAVILSHVLEHLEHPIDVLKQIGEIAPGGFLLLVQTNYRGIVPLVDKEKWYAWVPEDHFWHFTPAGVEYICRS
ncbi:MAG: class I SAM-dependent methyltransferase, partial [Pedobacter sp.]